MWYCKWILISVLLVAMLLASCNSKPEDPQGTLDPVMQSHQTTAPDEMPSEPESTPGQTTSPQEPNTENPFTMPAEPTEPSEPVESVPTEPTPTQPQGGEVTPVKMDYEWFHDLTPTEQQAYVESFASIDLFFQWYSAAQEEYEKENPPIIIDGNGEIDLGDFQGNN